MDTRNDDAERWESWRESSGRNNILPKCHRSEVNLVPSPRPCVVDVLKPSWRIAATRSAFCTGFAMYAAKTSRSSVASMPLYALAAMIGLSNTTGDEVRYGLRDVEAEVDSKLRECEND